MPSLSFALIVRNESALLPGCLESVAPIADEIVVTDTGSTDDTAAIAEAMGARVTRFTWCDDFSAARNAALEACTGDWVFSIDADERLAREDHQSWRALLSKPGTAWRVTTRNYSDQTHLNDFTRCAPGDPHAADFPGWFPSTKVRLFPRLDGVRFEGPVHELVNPSLERAGIVIHDTPLPVHHYAASQPPERLEAKRSLYLKLGEAKAAQAPDDPRAHQELAEQWIELGQYAEAIGAYRRAVELDPTNARLLAGLGAALLLQGQHAAAAKTLQLALRLGAEGVGAARNLVVAHLQLHQWQAGRETALDQIGRLGEDSELLRFAALAASHLGADDEARELARRAAEADPANVQARALRDSLETG